MITDLLQQFLGSNQATQALQTLQRDHGMSQGAAQNVLQTAAQAAQNHVSNQAAGSVAGLLGGLVSGSSISNLVSGGLGGLATGQLQETLTKATGLSPSIIGAVMPHLTSFLQERPGLGGAPAVPSGPQQVHKEAKPGAAAPAAAPVGAKGSAGDKSQKQ